MSVLIPDENGGYTKQGDDSHFQGDLGIRIDQRDHDYCRVPAGQIERWASRNFQDSSEWLLSPRAFQEICVKLGFPELDLFASRACHQIRSYLSWKENPHSLATEAFQQSWKHRGLLYAFPPFSMIGKVLLKVKTEEADVILITPIWSAQHWYRQVLGLSVAEPLLLPQLSNILVNPQGQVHPLVVNKTLRLVA